MPVVEAVQTFVGIANENEFYGHHYLSEVLKGDIRERLEQWAAAEEAHAEQWAPYKQLASWASQWFALRNTGPRGGVAAEQLDGFQHVQQGLLQALRYAIAPQHLELQAGMPVPVRCARANSAGKTCRIYPTARWCSNGSRAISCPPVHTAKNGAG